MIIFAFAEGIQLVPDGTLFLHIALILLMILVLNSTFFKPINRILEERERRTKGGSGSARDTLRQVEEKTSHYEQTLRAARAEGYRLMEQQRAEALQQRQLRLTQAREEVERTLAEQKSLIQTQMNVALANLTTDAQRLAAEIGGRVLHRPISDAVARSVFESRV